MTANIFDDSLIRRQGLEYTAKLPCGHTVQYLSKETAKTYADEQGAEIIGPQYGPWMPECFKVFLAA